MSLKKNLGPLQVQLISLGGIIGSGYFLGLGVTLAENGLWTILAYLMAGAIVWFVAMAMSELCVHLPREGSFVSHARELLGKKYGASWATGVGWSYWFNWCAYIPSEMMAGGLILHGFFPHIDIISWAIIFGISITLVNLLNVRFFGHIESFLSLLKIGAIGVFTGIGSMIWMQGRGLSKETIFTDPQVAPLSFLAAMVLVLVNFQGTELIALSAAETKNPEESIPKAARNVAIRTIAMYVLPIIVLILIFPISQASVEKSIFAQALSLYGYERASEFFSIVVVTAAISCANSGLYGAVRALYGLGVEGLAPQWVKKLNAQGVPSNATWITILMSWGIFSLYFFFQDTSFYTWLLSLSGFTGALCWISITLCQIRLRKINKPLNSKLYQMPGFPSLSYFSLFLQLLCIGFVVMHPTLRTSLILGIPAFLLPMIIQFFSHRKRYF